MGMIDFKVRNEDEDHDGGRGIRRSCLPNPFAKPLRSPSSPPPSPVSPGWTGKGRGAAGRYHQQLGDEEGEASGFDKELVSILSPVPHRGYQRLQQHQVPNSRSTTATSTSSPPPSSPVEWQIVSGSGHNHYRHHQQQQQQLHQAPSSQSHSRAEFSAKVSSSRSSPREVEHLLTPPTPSDRSARRRIEYERDLRSRRKQLAGRSAADDEMEPPGKWGESMATFAPPLLPRMRPYRPLSPRRASSSSPQEEQQILSVSGARRTSGQQHRRSEKQISERQGTDDASPPHSTVAVSRTEDSSGTGKAVGRHFEHPTFNVPFPLATTPPPPPPPPAAAQPPTRNPPLASSQDAPKRAPPSARRSRTSLEARMTPEYRLHAGEQEPAKRGEAAAENQRDDVRCYISSSGSCDDSDASDASSFDVAILDSESATDTPSGSSIMENMEVLNKLAMEHIARGEFENALSVFNHVLRIQQERHGEIHPANAGTYHNMGTVHAKRATAIGMTAGESEQRHCRAQAVSCFQAAARIARDSLGPTHPNVAVSLVRIGLILLESRQYQNALITFREALRLRICAFGRNHRLVANVYNNMGLCSAQLGDFEEAKGYLDAAIFIQRELAETGGADLDLLELGDTLFNLGGLNMEWIRQEGSKTSRILEAEACFSEVLEIRTKILGPHSEAVVQVKTLLDIARSLPHDVGVSKSATGASGELVRRAMGKDSSSRARSGPSRNMSSLRLSPDSHLTGRLSQSERPPLSQRSGTKERKQDSRESSTKSDRKEHLYSLLVSLVEQDPRRQDKAKNNRTSQHKD